MSHDIRSPLSSIISASSGHSGLSPGDSLKLVGSIASYMLEFVNCLLLSLRSEAIGKSLEVFNEYFSVYELLKEIQEMMSPLASQKKNQILIEGDPHERKPH